MMGRIKWLLVAIGLAVVIAPATAGANIPSMYDRIGSRSFATAYWEDQRGEYIPCGHIYQKWEWFPASERNTLAWTTLHGCTIHYNRAEHWDWWKLCAVTIHEYGHSVGYGHNYRWGSVMNAKYPNLDWGRRFSFCEYS
jgi:Matrixin